CPRSVEDYYGNYVGFDYW
nr:immunoglobulin heavy chain junction region [Mus musculus]